MKTSTLYHHAFSICATAAMLAGCGASQQPIGAPGAMLENSSSAQYARRPIAHPTSLFFYSRHPLKFTVRQTGYDGRFKMSDSACGYIASVSPKWASGPVATFKVRPISTPSGGTCVVTVADARGHMATVTVGNPGY